MIEKIFKIIFNNKIFVLFTVLSLLLLIFGVKCRDNNDKYMYIVCLLTAYGTCGVTIFNIFPFKFPDDISASIYYKKDYLCCGDVNQNEKINVIQIKIINNSSCGCTLYKILVWDSNDNIYNEDKAYGMPFSGRRFFCGYGVAIPPKDVCYLNYEEVDFKNMNIENLSKMKIQLTTSTGQKFEVKNDI